MTDEQPSQPSELSKEKPSELGPSLGISCEQEVDNDREGLSRHPLPQVESADWSN